MKKALLWVAAPLALASVAGAQTVTVNSGGGGDHTTLTAAINAVAGNVATPDIINITGGGPYDELLPVITSSVEIHGTGISRPVILLQLQATGNDGMRIACDGDVVLDSLVLLPSTTNTPSDDAMFATTATAGGTLNITLTNLLVTQNAGGAPAVTDPFTSTDVSTATRFGDDGIFLCGDAAFGGNGGIVNGTIDGCVVTHFSAGTGNDGFILAGNAVLGAATFDVSNTVVSFNQRFGFQLLSDANFNIIGTEAEPVMSVGNNFGGVSFDGITQLEYVVVDMTGIAAAGFPYCWRADSDTTFSFEANKCAFIGSEDRGLWLPFASASPKTVTVTNCTFYDNAAAIDLDNNDSDGMLTVSVSDSVIAGDPLGTFDNYALQVVTAAATQPVIQFTNCDLASSGPAALTGITAPASSTTPTVTGGSLGDPDFVSTTTLLTGAINPDLFDVNQGSFFNLATGSLPLEGYGNFVGTPPAAVADWEGYR